MFTIYIIQNTKSRKYYIGSTNNFSRRLKEHNYGHTLSTRRKGSWRLIYKENFINKKQATKREREIKSYKSGNAFKQLVNNNKR